MKFKTTSVAIIAVASVLATESNAQEIWGQCSSIDLPRRCHRDFDAGVASVIDRLQYGTGGNQLRYYPNHDEFGYSSIHASSIGHFYDGSCPNDQFSPQGTSFRNVYLNRKNSYPFTGARCPYELDSIGNRQGAPNAIGHYLPPENGINSHSRPNSGSNPNQRTQDPFWTSPADQRPQLNSALVEPGTNAIPNSPRPNLKGSVLVPPTSTQFGPPPQLPPHPSTNSKQPNIQGSNNDSSPGLVPPTNSDRN